MSLHTTKAGYERILVYGTTGTSKTFSALNIARWSQRTKSDAVFYSLDSDNSIVNQLEEEFPELSNVATPVPCIDYPDYVDGLRKVLPVVRPDDWIIVDFIGTYWSACQRYFTEQIFGEGIESYFLAARKEMELYNSSRGRKDKEQKKVDTFDGWKDWSIINKMHDRFILDLCMRQKCHVFATSRADKLFTEGEAADPKENVDIYGRWGFKPEGQKFLGHNFRTILLSQKDGKDYKLNSVKDKGRELLEGATVRDFTITYLKNIAGWAL